MTQPTPPARPTGDRRFARDVAKELDRRRLRRRLTLWTVLLVLIAAGALYLRLGGSLGLPGIGGAGQGDGGTARPLEGPRRCAIRVSASGVSVGGRAMSRDEAVAACKATTGADVVITGDAREGDWQDLNTALQAAGVKDIAVHQPGRPVGAPSAPPQR
ncbi:MAG TPA: hypothetical protein VF469_01330 [Kofleriaceae bacterium]